MDLFWLEFLFRGLAQIGGHNSLALCRQKSRQRIVFERLDSRDDANCIRLRAGQARVRPRTRDEQRIHFFLAELVILARDDFIDVNERRVHGIRGVARPAGGAIGAGARGFAVRANCCAGSSEQTIGVAPLAARFGDHLFFIPAEGMNDLEFFGDHIGDRLRLVADAVNLAARAGARA